MKGPTKPYTVCIIDRAGTEHVVETYSSTPENAAGVVIGNLANSFVENQGLDPDDDVYEYEGELDDWINCVQLTKVYDGFLAASIPKDAVPVYED